MDIVSISAVLNLLWYICTIIFVIHKFTSFFSRMYTVYRVVSKVKTGFVWLKNKILGIQPSTSYQPIATDEIDYHIPQQSEDLHRSKVDIEAPSALFSQFINGNNNRYNNIQTQSNVNKENVLSASNALLEFGMFLPFYKKRDEEEIPLVESQYMDAHEK